MGDRFGRIVGIALVIFIIAWIGDRFVRPWLLTTDEARPVTARGDLSEAERQNIEIFERSAPSVVYIYTRTVQVDVSGKPTAQRSGAGSGFLWDAGGHVVTNNHVVAGANDVSVRLDSGESIAARVVGTSPDHDLAVLRLSDVPRDLRPIPVGTSADLRVGQIVYAIGNPFGLSRTLTTGVVSALDRHLPTVGGREIGGVIQTDAPINPGNSGGPLLDSAGRLIGVNTAIISGTGASAGIGFAVPVDTVNRVVPALIRTGRAPRPGIGIAAADEEVSTRLGVVGVVVAEVLPGSAAEAAGLQGFDRVNRRVGDVITAVDGRPVRSVADMARELDRIGIGNEVELTVLRDGQTRTVRVRVIDIGQRS